MVFGFFIQLLLLLYNIRHCELTRKKQMNNEDKKKLWNQSTSRSSKKKQKDAPKWAQKQNKKFIPGLNSVIMFYGTNP